jgi:ubiquinone/menaquinone biosynthesis C-methylase UbiE
MDERAESFGSIAEDYDRLRPDAPPDAVEWLLPVDCQVAVDVGAGTGLFTRLLAARVPTVIAVEPDERMRAVLARRSTGVDVRDGRGEQLPVDAASADAVCVSSAWHWMDHERALREVARVLRPGGRFGVIWTVRDRVDWLRDLDEAMQPFRRDSPPAPDAHHRRHREVVIPAGGPFTAVAAAEFSAVRTMSLDDVVAMLGTYSGLITAPPDRRKEVLAAARAELAKRFPGVNELDVPIRSYCCRAERV